MRPGVDFSFLGQAGEPFAVVVDRPLPDGPSFGMVIIEKIGEGRLNSDEAALPGLRFRGFNLEMFFGQVDFAPVQRGYLRSP